MHIIYIINFRHIHTHARGHTKSKPVLGAPPINTYIHTQNIHTYTYTQAKYKKQTKVTTYKHTHKIKTIFFKVYI